MATSKLQSANKLIYPTGLTRADNDYLHIMVLTYQPPSTQSGQNFQFRSGDSANRVTGGGKNNRIQGNIFLPIPKNISDNNSVQWRSSELNPIAADAIQQLGGVIKDDIKIGEFGEAAGRLGERGKAFLDKYRGALEGAGVADALETFLVGKAVNVLGANVDLNDLISRRTGQVLNPNMELLFKSVNLRTFSYTFDFTPRTRQESNTVKGIINTFKKRMAAKSTASGNKEAKGLFISSPDVFQLQFMSGNEKHPFLHTHKICALTSMNVNYSGTGAYMTYEDSTPVQLSMDLTFNELSPVYTEDYDDISLDEGVGF